MFKYRFHTRRKHICFLWAFFFFFFILFYFSRGESGQTDDVDEKPELSKEKGSSRGQRGLMRKEEEEKEKEAEVEGKEDQGRQS